MLTEKDYCDYETCVALREIGYNAPQRLIPDYFGVFEEPQYDEKIHLYDAQKFLREEAGLHIEIHYDMRMGFEYEVREANRRVAEGSCFPSYEETLSTAIYMAIEYINDSIK